MALKILLADDSMTAQNLGRKILTEAGHEVVAVSHGGAAIKKLAEFTPDLAILDVYMPGYTGLEVCEKMKSDPVTAGVPVLLTVGKLEPFKPEEGAKVKADGLIIKPFEATDMLSAMQRWEQKIRATAAAAEKTQKIRPVPAQDFADDTYHDWKSVADEHADEHEHASTVHEETVEISPPGSAAAAAAAAAPAAAPVAKSDQTVKLSAAEIAALLSGQKPISAAVPAAAPEAEMEIPPPPPAVEVPSVAAAMPAFDLTPVEPVATEAAEPVAASAPVFEVAANMQDPAASGSIPAFNLEDTMPPTLSADMPAMQAAPAVELELTTAPALPETQAIRPELEPTSVEGPDTVEIQVEPELETTAAAATAEPMMQRDPAFEPTVMEATAAEVASSAVDPGLVTEGQDMSGFVTKFGVEGAEPVAFGAVSDLPPEVAAAISGGPAEAADASAETTEGVVESPEVSAEAPAAVSTDPVTPQPEPVPDPEPQPEPEPPAPVVAPAVEPAADRTQKIEVDPELIAQMQEAVASMPVEETPAEQEEVEPTAAAVATDEPPPAAAVVAEAPTTSGQDLELAAAMAAAVGGELSVAQAPVASATSSDSQAVAEAIHRVLERFKPELVAEIVRELERRR